MKTYIVDSFTDRPFAGNPAGVCIVSSSLSDDVMLNIASELGFSETAFIRQTKDESSYSIRFFTPVKEVPLCGHATLAAAKVLFSDHAIDTVSFLNINNDEFTVVAREQNMLMTLPRYGTVPAAVPDAMLRALGLAQVENVVFNEETQILLLEISDADLLASLTPNYAALLKSHDSIYGVLVTAPSADEDYDYHCRFFWPWSGTDEDPATGGTQTFLAPYWSDRLNRKKLRSFQSSARTGSLSVEVTDSKVLITCKAVIVWRGETTSLVG